MTETQTARLVRQRPRLLTQVLLQRIKFILRHKRELCNVLSELVDDLVTVFKGRQYVVSCLQISFQRINQAEIEDVDRPKHRRVDKKPLDTLLPAQLFLVLPDDVGGRYGLQEFYPVAKEQLSPVAGGGASAPTLVVVCFHELLC